MSEKSYTAGRFTFVLDGENVSGEIVAADFDYEAMRTEDTFNFKTVEVAEETDMGWDNTAHTKWESGKASKGDTPVLEFTSAEPVTPSGKEEHYYTIEFDNTPVDFDFII